MQKQVNVLVLQQRIILGKPETIIKKLDRTILKCRHLKPDLVILPEDAIFGITSEIAVEGKHLLALSKIAKKYAIYLIPGSFTRIVNGKKFNSTCVIDRNGKLLGFYEKRCLWSGEKNRIYKGNQSKIIETSIGKIGLQICADFFSPRISSDLKKLKPDIIVNVALHSQEDLKHYNSIVPYSLEKHLAATLSQARAIENHCYFIYCNYSDTTTYAAKTGRKYHYTSIGNSMIINPFGDIIARANTNKEQVLFSSLDLRRSHWCNLNYE